MRNAQSWFRVAGRFLVLGAVAWTAACDRGGEGKKDTGESRPVATQAERGGTAILAELSDMDKPLPFLFESAFDSDMVDVMYMALLRGAWEGGRQVFLTSHDSPMSLAWHWEYVGPDSATIRYRMRSGLKWSDGQPITARDVVWTYDMVRDPRVASPRQEYAENIDSVRAENDSTVVFHFKRRNPEMLYYSGLPIAPRHPFEGADPAQLRTHPRMTNPGSGNLVVSGPFMIGSWSRGQQIVLTPNPNFSIRPNLDQIVIRIVPDPTTRLVELQTQRVDFTRPIPHNEIPRLRREAPHVRFEREEKRNYDYIAYNPRRVEAFADPEIRRALTMGIDVPAIIQALGMQEYAVPGSGPYAPIFSELYDPQRMRPLPYDTAQARRILESKGWRDTNGDGIVDRDGKPFRFTLLTNTGNQRRSDVQQIVQQHLKRIGVDVQLQQIEFNTFQDRLINRNFEAALGNWGVGLSADLTELWAEDSPFNFVSYRNPEVTRLFQQARSQQTSEQANRYWRQAAEVLAHDQPYTWLYYFDQVDGVNNRLRGMRINTFGSFQNTWEWWIPRAQQRGGTAAR